MQEALVAAAKTIAPRTEGSSVACAILAKNFDIHSSAPLALSDSGGSDDDVVHCVVPTLLKLITPPIVGEAGTEIAASNEDAYYRMIDRTVLHSVSKRTGVWRLINGIGDKAMSLSPNPTGGALLDALLHRFALPQGSSSAHHEVHCRKPSAGAGGIALLCAMLRGLLARGLHTQGSARAAALRDLRAFVSAVCSAAPLEVQRAANAARGWADTAAVGHGVSLNGATIVQMPRTVVGSFSLPPPHLHVLSCFHQFCVAFPYSFNASVSNAAVNKKRDFASIGSSKR